MLLSVIVPVHNMEADDKLTWCMDSLVGQTLAKSRPGEMEIIAVDDCSEDGSLGILRSYEQRYPQLVRVIACEKNLHQGGAKNRGLAIAAGDWIGFIDADDWVTPDYYERLLAEAERTGADMAACDYSLVDRHTWETGKHIPNHSEEQTGELNREKYRLLLLDSGSLVIKIYRRHIVYGDLDPLAKKDGKAEGSPGTIPVFPEGIFYEDNAVACSWMLRAKRFAYLPEPLYYYYQHGTSTVHTLSYRNLNDRLEAGRLLLEAAKKEGYLEDYRPEIEFLFTNLFYRNTLFSAMAVYREGGRTDDPIYRFTKALAREMRSAFPGFQENPYYLERVDAEERGFMALQMRSQFLFYIKYRLLWKYRRIRKR
ncbi:MAG: glycosyltransferase [Lachnospiraceae bacterium]|nr:glycosyltransferase [Lachnospiraceae bacterium]